LSDGIVFGVDSCFVIIETTGIDLQNNIQGQGSTGGPYPYLWMEEAC
jgi:hypothetical protein